MNVVEEEGDETYGVSQIVVVGEEVDEKLLHDGRRLSFVVSHLGDGRQESLQYTVSIMDRLGWR